MINLRRTNDQQQEAQRHQARQAAREAAELDVLSVWYTVQAHIEAGRVDEARAIVKAYREGTI